MSATFSLFGLFQLPVVRRRQRIPSSWNARQIGGLDEKIERK